MTEEAKSGRGRIPGEEQTKVNTAALSPLRFLAALIIIFFHNLSGSAFLKVLPAFLLAGPEMVTFFYVLSGFVLVLAYYSRATFSPKDFFIRRGARIIPVYLLALSLSVALKIDEGNLNPAALILNIFLLQAWVPSYPLAINGPAWFLSCLLFFYALFPRILTWLRDSRPAPRRLLLICLSLWSATQVLLTLLLNSSLYRGVASSSHDLLYYFPPVHLCSFLLGVAGAYVLVTGRPGEKSRSQVQSTVRLLLPCLLFLFIIECEPSLKKLLGLKLPFESSFYAPLFLWMVIAFSVSENTITRALSAKPFIFLGNISFSIYILQNPVLSIASRFKPMALHYDLFLLLYVLLLLAVGVLILSTVEGPLRNLVPNRRRGETGPPLSR